MTCATAALAAILAASALALPFEAEIDSALAETADIYPVPKALVLAVISVESGFRPSAVSRAGAKGLMQLMPYTARRVGIGETELLDPQRNILGGVRLLAVLLRHYEGDLVSALVAYNARPRRLLAPVPQNGETPGYVWKVLATLRRLSSSRVMERRAAAGPTYRRAARPARPHPGRRRRDPRRAPRGRGVRRAHRPRASCSATASTSTPSSAIWCSPPSSARTGTRPTPQHQAVPAVLVARELRVARRRGP